jgi:hypothetical protein
MKKEIKTKSNSKNKNNKKKFENLNYFFKSFKISIIYEKKK